MKFLENYKSSREEVFALFVKEGLEIPLGDFEALYFEIVPALNKGNQWKCLIKISGTLQAVWDLGRNNNSKTVYKVLTELGTLRIKQAIEKTEPFLVFMFTTYDAQKSWQEERGKLSKELKEKEIQTKKTEENNIGEIFSRNIEYRWKVLKASYELKGQIL